MAGIDISHQYRHQVIYAQVDRMDVVYYSRYYEFFEAARSALLRSLELPYAQIEAQGIMLPVIESNCRYFGSATFEDILTIESSIIEQPKVRMRINYRVFKGEEHELVAEGYTVHAFVNKVMKPVRIPRFVLEQLHKYSGQALASQ
ncbi:acyl-CoA thioesterase [Candidatus Neomarinimicrobiota bacterium]